MTLEEYRARSQSPKKKAKEKKLPDKFTVVEAIWATGRAFDKTDEQIEYLVNQWILNGRIEDEK